MERGTSILMFGLLVLSFCLISQGVVVSCGLSARSENKKSEKRK
jgi:hypothetical protein